MCDLKRFFLQRDTWRSSRRPGRCRTRRGRLAECMPRPSECETLPSSLFFTPLPSFFVILSDRHAVPHLHCSPFLPRVPKRLQVQWGVNDADLLVLPGALSILEAGLPPDCESGAFCHKCWGQSRGHGTLAVVHRVSRVLKMTVKRGFNY